MAKRRGGPGIYAACPAGSMSREQMQVSSEDVMFWRKARAALHTGAFEAASLGSEGVAVRNSARPDGPVLTYSWDAWGLMLMGMMRGDFDRSKLEPPAEAEAELTWHG